MVKRSRKDSKEMINHMDIYLWRQEKALNDQIRNHALEHEIYQAERSHRN